MIIKPGVIRLYATLVKKGVRSLDQVPQELREAVEAELAKM